MTSQRTTPPPEFVFLMDATAQAEAENALRKATRPWFKKKRFILPLGIVVLVVMIQAANGVGDTGTSHTATSDSKLGVTSALGAQAMAVGIGSKVRDGTFDFVVTGVEHPGKTLAGKASETLTAQGEFVVVRVNVTNIGKEARRLGCSCQLLSNDEGQKFEPSPAILSTRDALKYVEWINPGETVKGAVMLFDVAPGTQVATIELHDSPFSPGVKVKLLGRSG